MKQIAKKFNSSDEIENYIKYLKISNFDIEIIKKNKELSSNHIKL